MESPHSPQTQVLEGACAIKVSMKIPFFIFFSFISFQFNARTILCLEHVKSYTRDLLTTMVKQVFSKIGRVSFKRPYKTLSERYMTTDLPLVRDSFSNQSISKPRDLVRTQKLADLVGYVSLPSPSPSRVWAYYLDIFNLAEYHDIPLQVHQNVLRKCTPSSAELRRSAARRRGLGNVSRAPYIHEARFKAIFRNIRAAGWSPTLEDYHFVLEQFAAAGHHNGAMHVYQELTHRRIQPRTKTFGLCLQTIAHRLTLPCSKLSWPSLVSDTRKQCAYFLKEMCIYNIPFTSVNLDLTVRILKETLDERGFDLLLKVGYGIDLAYPDRSYVAYLDKSTLTFHLGELLKEIPTPQPFSTSTLNTTIDMLGRFGNISKLVQAFEVLTQPLPPQLLPHLSASFDDDDDFITPPPGPKDDDGVNPPPTQLPHADPNTTTYNTLLRHISRAGHTVLARHYLIQAIRLDWDVDRTLRGALMVSKYPHDVRPPHFALNRGTFLPVFGAANRAKDTQLLRWLSSKLPRVLHRKRRNLEWYTKFHANLSNTAQHDLINSTDVPSESSCNLSIPSASEIPSTHDPPRALAQPVVVLSPKLPPIPAIDIDLDTPTNPDPPVSHFDINLHLNILQRDIDELESFARHLYDILGRTTQRIKERLGRRVSQDKDIFLLTDRDHRRKVSRHAWREMVNFKPRYGFRPLEAGFSRISRRTSCTSSFPSLRLGWITGYRGIATFVVPQRT